MLKTLFSNKDLYLWFIILLLALLLFSQETYLKENNNPYDCLACQNLLVNKSYRVDTTELNITHINGGG